MSDGPARGLADIDKGRLDEEWVGQPALYHRWARKAADAKLAVADAKAALDVVESEVELDVRERPAAYGLTDVKEAAVKATVKLDKRVRRAGSALNKAKHVQDLCEAAVGALDHRKRALENLVSLWTKDYFAAPKAPDGAREKLDEAAKRKAFRPRGAK